MTPEDDPTSSGNATGESGQKLKKKRGKEQLDLSRLDEKSVKIMVMLMVRLLQDNLTTQEFF